MIKTSIEKVARSIGFDIANSDDIVQADLLNGLGDGFIYMQELDMQLCYIANKLTPQAEKFIVKLSEFIKSK